MFTLYARPGMGSTAVEAVLAEIGAPHKIIDILRDAEGKIPASYAAINPRGEIPTLQLADHSLMTESAAMVIYLADLYPVAGLAPNVNSPTRAVYLRWMLYFASAVYMADLRYYYSARYSTQSGAADGIREKARIDMMRDFEIFAESLGRGPYVLGSQFSAVDIYAAMLLSWAPNLPALFAKHPNLKALYALVAKRPKIAPVWLRNEMPVA